MEEKERILHVLEEGYLLSLATQDDGGVWVSDVIYVHDDELALYWLSKKDVRHSQALLKNSHVAGAITVSEDSRESDLGIQISGVAEELEGSHYALAVKHRLKRGYPVPEEDEDMRGEYVWYKLTPTKIELIDQRNLGFDKKILES